jgi:hypothetical protein
VATTRLSAASSRAGRRWLVSVAATVVATGTLEIVATAAGGLLAASRFLDRASHGVLLGFLAATYLVWVAALRRNLAANWRLLEATGTSTNAFSKAAYELVRARPGTRRAMRAASIAGYVVTEVAKEAPYYAGAFGAMLVSDSVDGKDALIFLAGTNVGAALYEYTVAKLAGTNVARRERRAMTVHAAVDAAPATVGVVP